MARADWVASHEGRPELVRFGTAVDVEGETWLASQVIQRGNRPEVDDMAALLVELAIRKDPKLVQRLAAARKRSD